jgi:transcriptional regulator with XRE-family HTH domain
VTTELGKELLRVREALGLSQRAFADHFGVSLRTLLRIEKGGTAPRGVTRSAFERVLSEARAQLVPNGAHLANATLSEPSPLEASGGQAQTEIQETELILQELGAWMRRTVMRRPEALAQISSGVRRLINEVEGISEPTADTAEQNKDSPRKVAWGPNGEGG